MGRHNFQPGQSSAVVSFRISDLIPSHSDVLDEASDDLQPSGCWSWFRNWAVWCQTTRCSYPEQSVPPSPPPFHAASAVAKACFIASTTALACPSPRPATLNVKPVYGGKAAHKVNVVPPLSKLTSENQPHGLPLSKLTSENQPHGLDQSQNHTRKPSVPKDLNADVACPAELDSGTFSLPTSSLHKEELQSGYTPGSSLYVQTSEESFTGISSACLDLSGAENRTDPNDTSRSSCSSPEHRSDCSEE